MSIEEQIDNAIRDCAVRPGMCVYPPRRSWGATDRGSRSSTGWTETRGGPVLSSSWDEVHVWTADDERLAARVVDRIHQLRGDDAEPDGVLPVYRRAVDEVKLLNSIKRDRSWWRRLARWIRRSGS